MANETRAEAVRTERRRKAGDISLQGLKLAVDESKLDRRSYAYRFVNDKDGRIQQLHNQDWDPAPEAALYGSTGEGSVQSKFAGRVDGKPYNTVLMRKPKRMHDEDQRAKQAPIDAVEESIRRGTHGVVATPELASAQVYTPGGSNTLERA